MADILKDALPTAILGGASAILAIIGKEWIQRRSANELRAKGEAANIGAITERVFDFNMEQYRAALRDIESLKGERDHCRSQMDRLREEFEEYRRNSTNEMTLLKIQLTQTLDGKRNL
jgi:hypothetical protein